MSLRRPILYLRPPRLNARPFLSSAPSRPPRMSLKRPAAAQTSPAAPHLTRLSLARQRLRTPEFWRELRSQWKSIMKLFLALQLGFLSMQGSLHFALNTVEENKNPTSEDWPFKARYYVRRARIPNAWNPWGPAQDPDAVKEFLDKALAIVERDLQASGFELRSEEWKREYMKLRKALAEWYEARSDYEAARREYETALAVPLPAGSYVSDRVPAAIRLAKISEWAHDMPAALEALQKAVEMAYSDADGLPPRLPSPGSPENTKELLDAVSALAVYLARHEQLSLALETFSRVLVRRQEGTEVPDPRMHTEMISDPCAQAATMASIGELMFALGKKEQGIVWEENAYEIAEDLAEYRPECKECVSVAAGNLVKMAEILKADAEKRRSGWFGGASAAEKQMSRAEELKQKYRDAAR